MHNGVKMGKRGLKSHMRLSGPSEPPSTPTCSQVATLSPPTLPPQQGTKKLFSGKIEWEAEIQDPRKPGPAEKVTLGWNRGVG